MSHHRPVLSRRLVATVAAGALLFGAATPGQALAGPKQGSATSGTSTTTTDGTSFKTDGRKNR